MTKPTPIRAVPEPPDDDESPPPFHFECDCCGGEAFGWPSDTWRVCVACEIHCTVYKPCDRWRG